MTRRLVALYCALGDECGLIGEVIRDDDGEPAYRPLDRRGGRLAAADRRRPSEQAEPVIDSKGRTWDARFARGIPDVPIKLHPDPEPEWVFVIGCRHGRRDVPCRQITDAVRDGVNKLNV